MENRRITRSSTGNNENDATTARITAKAEDGVVTRRPFADQRNQRTVRYTKPVEVVRREVDVVRKEVPKGLPLKPKPVIKKSPVRHPELAGLEREYQTADYMDDIYQYLLSKEKEFVVPDSAVNKATITAKMRSILVDWLVQVHGRFHLFAETLHLSVYLVDTVLAHVKVEKADLQLVGMACMLVACKFEEMYVPDIKDFEYIADNAFTKQQIIKMEIKVLVATRYALSRPHSITFLRWLTKEADSTHRQHNLAKYFGEVALLDHTVTHLLPSQVALLALYMSCALSNKELPINRLAKLIGWSESCFAEAVPIFAKAILRVHAQEKLTAIRNKYNSSKNSNVANLSEDDLEALKRF